MLSGGCRYKSLHLLDELRANQIKSNNIIPTMLFLSSSLVAVVVIVVVEGIVLNVVVVCVWQCVANAS